MTAALATNHDRDVEMAKQQGSRKLISRYVDKTGLVRIPAMHTGRPREGEDLWVPVKVVDVRSLFGRLDLLVEPVGGEGQQWVSDDRVAFTKKQLREMQEQRAVRAEDETGEAESGPAETEQTEPEPPEPERPAKRRPRGRH